MKRYSKFSIFQWQSRCSKNFKIGTWNIGGCSLENPVKFEELKMVMNDHDISILCLQETHLSESFYMDMDGFLFIASGNDDGKREYGGVGFLVSPSMRKSVKSFL